MLGNDYGHDRRIRGAGNILRAFAHWPKGANANQILGANLEGVGRNRRIRQGVGGGSHFRLKAEGVSVYGHVNLVRGYEFRRWSGSPIEFE